MRPTIKPNGRSEPGLVLLNKEPGKTSFQALSPLKKQYGTSLGHTGTLDKFAEGLLVVLVGRFTKLNPLFTGFDKVYEAEFVFGEETDTLDPEGEVISQGELPPEELILSLKDRFKGKLAQVPPDYSAIHVQGKRAYERVRSGESLDLAPRQIEIYSLDVLSWNAPRLKARIHCSKGTYIRSLARDWGRAAGCGAYVSALRRLSVGPFLLPEKGLEFWTASLCFDYLQIPQIQAVNPGKVLQGVPLELVGQDFSGLERFSLWDNDQFLAYCEKDQRTGGSSTNSWRYIIVNN